MKLKNQPQKQIRGITSYPKLSNRRVDDLNTVIGLQKSLRNGQVSCKEITQDYLERIGSRDKQINSFINLNHEVSIRQAEIADTMIAKGKATALTGIPIAHKDIFCTRQLPTTCGSKMLENFIAPYDATVITKLENAGAVLLGKTNMDEFAMGSSNETSYFGPVHNPWNPSCVPGGSSGGSAAAVAANLAPCATGTDTGGSIRQPASFCGLTGLKPTYGTVSRYGMIAYASSLDQAGPICHNAEDAGLLYSFMLGFDPKDSTSIASEKYSFALENNQHASKFEKLTIGLPKLGFQERETDTALIEIQKVLEGLGHKFVEIELPNIDASISSYYVIASAEASTNLSRYDGVRFGYRCEAPKNLQDLYVRTRSEGFGEEVKRRILTGTYALSVGYFDQYYLKALKIRRLIARDFHAAFADVDLILTPTTPSTAFELESLIDNPVEMYQQDLFTVPANLAGLPAISIPCGFRNEMPIGAQFIANAFNEDLLISVSREFQKETDFHNRTPSNSK